MTETIPATYLNKPETGYFYAALLSENAQVKVSGLLQELTEELPEIIWPMPPEAMHITLCEIIQARKVYSQDKDTLFTDREDEYVHGAAEVLRSIPRFSVMFNRIEVSPEAIIIRTENGSAFNSIREKLLGRITLPDETKRPPNIIHSSIARYVEAVDIERVQSVMAKYSIMLEEPITEFKLIKTLVPPLLEYEELAGYPLATKATQL